MAVRRWSPLLIAAALVVALGGYALWRSDLPLAENTRSVVASKLRDYFSVQRAFPGRSLEERLQAAGLAIGVPVLLRIFKEESKLEVWAEKEGRFQPVLTYDICKWSGRLGPKLREGDGQAPEGFYFASSHQLNPRSSYHRAINIGFPNAYDQAHGRTGSFLMIHGACVSIGCYAMTDAGIDDIYRLVEGALKAGQASVPIHILPFRMTAENGVRHTDSVWTDFWNNLAEGDRMFLSSGIQPRVSVCNNRYAYGETNASCQRVSAWEEMH